MCLQQLKFVFQPSTPTKPVMFAEWLAGVSPPDPQTINKHVHDMVEVSLAQVSYARGSSIARHAR